MRKRNNNIDLKSLKEGRINWYLAKSVPILAVVGTVFRLPYCQSRSLSGGARPEGGVHVTCKCNFIVRHASRTQHVHRKDLTDIRLVSFLKAKVG